MRPASRCPAAGADRLVRQRPDPLAGMLLARPLPRAARRRSPARYPFVEAATGGARARCALWRFGPTPAAVVAFAFTAALLLITFIDFDHLFIPGRGEPAGRLDRARRRGAARAASGSRDAAIGAALGGGILWLVAWGYERRPAPRAWASAT